MKLFLKENNLQLKYPFSISRHTYYSQPNIIIKLQDGDFSGFGEATINPYYHITIDNLKEAFNQMSLRFKKYHFDTPDKLWDDFSDFLNINPFALAALNNACWDLYGKKHGERVVDLIDMEKGTPVLTSYTLGIDNKEMMMQKMQELPWPIYKIKLGTTDDIELIRFLKSKTDSIFRVDANCAWTVQKTLENSVALKYLGVEFIEQPLPKNDPGQKECFGQSVLPLMADESCCVESDVEKCFGNFDGINIKLLKCGGLTPAIRMIKKARSLGLELMVGCMSETSIGISAAAQLLPFVDFADLDGPLLLAEDVAQGIEYNYGKISISGNPGLGITYLDNKGYLHK
jgi:L-Ala-D/L-Glu epimerase